GMVLDQAGQPAEGAVVTSSAGGQATCDYAGHYRLATSVPVEAQSLQITATGSGRSNLKATRTIAQPAGSGTVWVDPLNLSLGASCSPSWLPTFGGLPGVGSQSGVGGQVYALATLDDGSGPHLFVAGSFAVVGGVSAQSIAKWDGAHWTPLG